MQGLYDRTGKMPADLVMPDFPEDLRYLWEFHLSLRMGVREMMTWTDIVAWGAIQTLAPESREVEALFYLDAIYRNPPKE